MTKNKPTLWERTKDIATTYTGTFIVVMILNQLLFFGFCLNPICLIAAMPHVLLITVAIGTAINKMGNWGERQVAKKTTQSISRGMEEFGNAYNSTMDELDKVTAAELKKSKERQKAIEEEIKRLESGADHRPQQPVSKLDLDKYRPSTTSKNKKAANPQNAQSNSQRNSATNPKPENSAHRGHQKVFITKNNLSNIAQRVDTSRFSEQDFDNLYRSKLSHILSHKELALLCVYKEVCQDPSLAFEVYKKIEESSPKNKYVFEGGSKSFHRDKDCDLLHGDYFNIEIPPEIKAKGDDAISRFREFCIENRILIETDEGKFLNKLQAAFMLVNPPVTVKANNSGLEEVENLDLKLIEQQIDSVLIDAEHYRNSSKTNADVIARLGYGSHRVKETDDPTHPLHSWHFKYKLPLKELMRHYFRIRFNEDLSFDGFLLEKLGLKPCKKCCT